MTADIMFKLKINPKLEIGNKIQTHLVWILLQISILKCLSHDSFCCGFW